MSRAMELLVGLAEENLDEQHKPHIVINADRTVTVPDELKIIAVQYDNNVETVTFDCPRYWGEYDFSTMDICIKFKRPDEHIGRFVARNVEIDSDDDAMIHFDWTITSEVTEVGGRLYFLVSIEDHDIFSRPRWNSHPSKDLFVQPNIVEEVTE